MGLYALYIGRLYAIHGTNANFGIGLRVSHGCVRLRNDDIKFLFENVPVGTRVQFIDEPVKATTEPDGSRYIEVHNPLSTTEAQFQGGEIVPIFFTGATFGCVAAPLLGLPPQLGAALGMVALFCGCTNSPLASICLAIEVFGGQCVSLFALACAVSYMLSSYFSLYREQHFLHSKLRIVGVQRVHGHWSETDAAHLTTNDDGEN